MKLTFDELQENHFYLLKFKRSHIYAQDDQELHDLWVAIVKDKNEYKVQFTDILSLKGYDLDENYDYTRTNLKKHINIIKEVTVEQNPEYFI